MIASVESGSSRREAAEEFDVSASSAIKWVAAYRTTGSCAAKPRGGSTSPLEKYANFLLTLIEGQPDLTLDEVVCAMRKRKLPGSRTAVRRFFQRHKIAFKKKPERGGERQRADVARARRALRCENRACLTRPGSRVSRWRHPPIPRSCGCMADASAASDWWIMSHRGIGRRSPSWLLCVGMA